MNTKTFKTLELDKILDRLTTYASFSASEEMLRALEPSPVLEEVQRRQQETTEARDLLEERGEITIGGSRDVRPYAHGAARGMLLTPLQLLEIKGTLLAAATLRRAILAMEERFPLLADLAYNLHEAKHVVAAIQQVIDDQGEVQDSASPALARIRGDLRSSHNKLHTKLQSIVTSSSNAPYLQEAIITMRSGRYVIPIKAEAKGRIKGIVHDQSSSGATLFIEPLATVEINNQIRELELAEEEEIRRLLAELTEIVGKEADAIILTVEMLATLDCAFARAKYANALRASAPTLIGFDEDRNPGSTIRLFHARHPLLDPQTVVPIDVELAEDTHILVVTGPNTGGKTVSLKTVGLLVLMAQCGLHLPTSEDSVLTVFHAIYADIGDEQSIEQSLSTFSSHLRNIIGILDQADRHSLILLDELGSGTDPAEGSAIARALLTHFLEEGVTTFATTHYPELKLYAHSTAGVRNASVEFDVETLSPTYRLIIGLPGRSNALAIAERLGLPTPIIEAARSYVGEDDLQVDTLLDEIHQARDDIQKTQARLVKMESEVQAAQHDLEGRLDGIEEERHTILTQAREEAESELEAVREEIEGLRRKMRTIPPMRGGSEYSPAEMVKQLESDAKTLKQIVTQPIERRVAPLPQIKKIEEQAPERGLRPGDRVFVSSLNTEGEIAAVHAGNDVEIQVGTLRVRVDADSLEWRPSKKEPDDDRRFASSVHAAPTASPGMELHVRGFMVDDAIPAVDEYLDQAYLAGLPWVHIVHGRGTGALRKAIRAHLRQHPLVNEYSKAPEDQGGDGVTVVRFVPL